MVIYSSAILVTSVCEVRVPCKECPGLANCVDPDQLASSEANWSGSALFVIKYVFLSKTLKK